MEDPAYVTAQPVPLVYEKPKKRGLGCFLGFGLGCFASLLLFVGLPVLLVFLAGKVVTTEMKARYETAMAESDNLAEQVDDGKIPVLRLELNGVITGEWESPWYTDPTSDAAVLDAIRAASTNEDIKGILLVVNSPGGSVTASDNLYHALEVFKQSQPGRKVIVTAGDVLASGAYYFAMQADWIRVQPTTVIGSIGVIMPGINLSGLATRIGMTDNSIASGASKDLGNPLKPVNPAHNAVLQTIVDGLYVRFVEIVAKGRKMQTEDVKKIADGRVFTATDALNLRLVDDIGYEDTLDPRIAELFGCNIEDLYLYENEDESTPFKAFFSAFPKAIGKSFTEAVMRQDSTVPQYRW